MFLHFIGHELETISQLQLEIALVKRRLSNQYKVRHFHEDDAIQKTDSVSTTSDRSIVWFWCCAEGHLLILIRDLLLRWYDSVGCERRLHGARSWKVCTLLFISPTRLTDAATNSLTTPRKESGSGNYVCFLFWSNFQLFPKCRKTWEGQLSRFGCFFSHHETVFSCVSVLYPMWSSHSIL